MTIKIFVQLFKKMLPLFAVQFFTWLALFSLWIYANPVITKYIFHTTDSESKAFENGTKWVGIYFAFYSLLAAVLAFFIPVLNKKIGKYFLHSLALFAGSIGFLSFYFISSQYVLLLSFLFISIAWSSISNVPYLIVSEMATEKEMSIYFGVFNFSVVIPQVTAAFLLAYLTKRFFNGETIYTIVFGGASMFIASLLMFVYSFYKKN